MWTEERVDILKKLWADGLSASQVAGQLGGVTRNAVIGKVHRLGLSGRTTSSRSASSRASTSRTSPGQSSTGQSPIEHSPTGQSPANRSPSSRTSAGEATATAHQQKAAAETGLEAENLPGPLPLTEIKTGEGVTVLSLTDRTCKWPVGDPGEPDFHFCARRSTPGAPYCAEHARMAYQPTQPRKRADRKRNHFSL